MKDYVHKVGRRKKKAISLHASAENLVEGAQFNDSLQSFPTGKNSCIPKGVYYFKSHQEAEEHRIACIIRGITAAAESRR